MKAAPCAAVAIGLAMMPATAFQNPAGANSSVPSFKDYQVPALEIFKGQPAEPRFKTSGQRKFESRIHLAAGRGADFAGHFVIAQWGCGTGCVQVAVIDVQGAMCSRDPSEHYRKPGSASKPRMTICSTV
jgi:hypothetical protein